jgi:hypothetical protein
MTTSEMSAQPDLQQARRRSASDPRPLRAPGIDPNLSSPSANSHSMPEIRGEPSARNVAMVLCLPASKSRRTPAANSGSARSTSFHAATAAVCARSPSVPRHLSSFRDIVIAELGDRLAVPANPGRAGLPGRGSGDTDALGGRGRMARIGRLHHGQLTDRVSGPKRELQGNRFAVPRICRVHNWVLCARAVDPARLRAAPIRRSRTYLPAVGIGRFPGRL